MIEKTGRRAFTEKVRCINKMYFHGVYSRDTEASWYHVALKSQNTCTNKQASSIVFGCLSPSFCTINSKQKFKKHLWSSWWYYAHGHLSAAWLFLSRHKKSLKIMVRKFKSQSNCCACIFLLDLYQDVTWATHSTCT